MQKVAGKSSELSYELVDYRPAEQVKLVGEGKNLKATDTLIFERAEGGGAKVTYRAEFDFSGPSQLAEPALKLLLSKVADGCGQSAQSWSRSRPSTEVSSRDTCI